MRIPEIEGLRMHVGKGESLPLVLVAGGEDAVRQGVEDVLAKDLGGGGATVSFVRVDAGPKKTDAWEVLAQVVGNPPMFGEGFVVVVSNCDAAQAPPELKAFLESPVDHVRIALYADYKADRSGLAKAVSRVGKVIKPKDLRDYEAEKVAAGEAREHGLRMDRRAVSALVDLVGGDRSAIRSAMESLAEYGGKGATISEHELRGLVTRSSKPAPWDMDDAVAARDLGKCVKVACRLLEDGRKPMVAFNALVRLARNMLISKDLLAEKVSAGESMKRLDIKHPFPLKKIMNASKRYSREELASFLRGVPRMEMQVKRNEKLADAVLTSVLTKLVGRG